MGARRDLHVGGAAEEPRYRRSWVRSPSLFYWAYTTNWYQSINWKYQSNYFLHNILQKTSTFQVTVLVPIGSSNPLVFLAVSRRFSPLPSHSKVLDHTVACLRRNARIDGTGGDDHQARRRAQHHGHGRCEHVFTRNVVGIDLFHFIFG